MNEVSSFRNQFPFSYIYNDQHVCHLIPFMLTIKLDGLKVNRAALTGSSPRSFGGLGWEWGGKKSVSLWMSVVMFFQAGSKSAMWEKIKQLAEKEAETPGFCCFWYPKHFNSWVISHTLYILTVISSFYLNELELNFCYLQHRVLTNNESGIRLKSLTLPTGEGLRTQALEPDCLGSSPGSFHLLVIYNLGFDVTICKRRITVPTNRDGLNVKWVSTLKPLEQSLTHSNHLTGVGDSCSHCSITAPSVGDLMRCFADVPTVTRHLASHIPYYMTQGESREGPSQAGTGSTSR